MEAATGSPAQDATEHDPRFVQARKEGQGDPGRENVAHAAMGAELNGEEERSALDWLLGAPVLMLHTVPVDYETPVGMTKITFVLRQLDTRVIEKIEQKYVSDATGRIDRIGADVEMVADALVHLEDATGRQVKITDDEFVTVPRRDPNSGEVEDVKLASTHMALERRFAKQLGLINSVAIQVRRVAGYDPERVGSAQRRLVDASLG